MQFKLLFVAGTLLCASVAHPAASQQARDGHASHSTTAPDGSAATRAYQAASQRMHGSMTMSYTGDADIDFIAGMIPHHQGAIDMARIELEHGKDPEARRIAEEVIAAQEQEIAVMKAWLAKRGR
jgi:uncharacterized protein (DUF305 family)